MSRLHLPQLSFGRDSKLTCLTFHTLPLVIVQCLRSDACYFGHLNRSCLLPCLFCQEDGDTIIIHFIAQYSALMLPWKNVIRDDRYRYLEKYPLVSGAARLLFRVGHNSPPFLLSYLPPLSLSPSFLTFPLPFSFLGSYPLNSVRGMRERCKLPQRVRAEPSRRQTVSGTF